MEPAPRHLCVNRVVVTRMYVRDDYFAYIKSHDVLRVMVLTRWNVKRKVCVGLRCDVQNLSAKEY